MVRLSNPYSSPPSYRKAGSRRSYSKLFFFILLIVAGAAGYMQFAKKGDAKADAAATYVKVEKGSLEENVTAQGKLEPKEYVDVGAQVSGQLKKLHVEIGDTVKKGALLAEIDPRVYQARVDADKAGLKTLNAQLAEQNAQVEFAKQQYDRNLRLLPSKAVSKQAVEDTQTALKVAEARAVSLKAQIEQAESALEGDEANLSYTKIYAPMSGTITTNPTREGQTVNASQTAPVIVQVANLDVMTVRAQVAEADVSRLKPDMEVYFTTLGTSEKKWKGTIRQILPTPETINDVVLYNALVDVKNDKNQLMTGMSTQMFFVVGNAQDVLLMPVEGLGKRLKDQDNEDGPAYRVKLKDGTESVVHVGLMSRTEVEIKSGLKEGDEVTVRVMKDKPAGGGLGGRGMGGMPRL